MLVNKTKEKVKVVYNGKFRDLDPGQGIDIRDFDVENKHVIGAEKHIMNKHPGVYEQRPNTGADPNVQADAGKIKELQASVQSLAKELEDLKASEKMAREKHATANEEMQAAQKEVLSMRKEVDKYKAERDELEEENQKLRLEVSTKKKL